MTAAAEIFQAASERDVSQTFEQFVSRCETTVVRLFRGDANTVDRLRGWLHDVAPDVSAKADIVHSEPLYIVLDFLRISDESPNYRTIEDDYIELARQEGWK